MSNRRRKANYAMTPSVKKKRKSGKPKIHASQKTGNIDGTDSWEVEAIVDYRITPGNLIGDLPDAKQTVYFAVAWRGYGEDDITLEPITNLLQSMHLVKKFLKGLGKELKVDSESQEAWIEDIPKSV